MNADMVLVGKQSTQVIGEILTLGIATGTGVDRWSGLLLPAVLFTNVPRNRHVVSKACHHFSEIDATTIRKTTFDCSGICHFEELLVLLLGHHEVHHHSLAVKVLKQDIPLFELRTIVAPDIVFP